MKQESAFSIGQRLVTSIIIIIAFYFASYGTYLFNNRKIKEAYHKVLNVANPVRNNAQSLLNFVWKAHSYKEKLLSTEDAHLIAVRNNQLPQILQTSILRFIILPLSHPIMRIFIQPFII